MSRSYLFEQKFPSNQCSFGKLKRAREVNFILASSRALRSIYPGIDFSAANIIKEQNFFTHHVCRVHASDPAQ